MKNQNNSRLNQIKKMIRESLSSLETAKSILDIGLVRGQYPTSNIPNVYRVRSNLISAIEKLYMLLLRVRN